MVGFRRRPRGIEHIEIRDLYADDAELIGDAETAVYSQDNPSLLNGSASIRAEFGVAADDNFSVGAVDCRDGRLIAYFLCYIDVASDSDEPVAYGSDFAILPSWRAAKSKAAPFIATAMLERALRRTWERRLPVEGEMRQVMWWIVQRNPEFLEGLRYRLAAERALPDYNGGEDFHWVRLEPLR